MPNSSNKTSVNVTRILYLLVCELAGTAIAYQSYGPDHLWIGIIGGLIVGAFFIMVESMMKQFTLRGFSTATFGLIIGIFCAWLLTTVKISVLFATTFNDIIKKPEDFILTFNVALYATFGFLGTVLALRSNQDDFAFIIPYVRFRQNGSSGRPLILDADVILDGRVPSLMTSGFLEPNVIIPRFILEEIQNIATSPSPGRRQLGQRGLDSLEELQKSKAIRVTIHDTETADETRDTLLLQTCRVLDAKLLTIDENLTKIARIQNVDVLNINELSTALKPKVTVGARLQLPIVRNGKEDHQGVGYLPDGTMIVVNNANDKQGTTQDVTVISTINTSAGLMVFAELNENL